jgi:hypothetical protein
VRKTDADNVTASTTIQSATGLDFTLAAGTTYTFEYFILFQSAATNTGIRLAVDGPASPSIISYSANIPVAADGTGGMYAGWGTTWDDTVNGTGVQTANTTYVARIHGVVQTNAAGGTLRPRFRTETNGTNVTIKTGSWGAIYPG